MCTAISVNFGRHLFGRTLDFERGFGERVVIAPRNFPLKFRHSAHSHHHPAIIGMASVVEGTPLFFDGANEEGVAMAGLNFEGFSHYPEFSGEGCEVASFDLIPYILAKAKTLDEACDEVSKIRIVNTPFSKDIAPSPLHFIIASKTGAVTVESTKRGLKIYDNPVGVLTNNPPFPYHITRLFEYMGLSCDEPDNTFSKKLRLKPYSRGMGGIGLPGDASSPSRFTRAVFTSQNAIFEKECAVSQFFHLLSSVEMVKGCVRLGGGNMEYTRYSSLIDTEKSVYYYTTYENRRINAIRLKSAYLEGDALLEYPLIEKEDINYIN